MEQIKHNFQTEIKENYKGYYFVFVKKSNPYKKGKLMEELGWLCQSNDINKYETGPFDYATPFTTRTEAQLASGEYILWNSFKDE